MKFIAIEDLNLCVFTQTHQARTSLPDVVGVEGVDLVLSKSIAKSDFAALKKVSIWMNGAEGRKSYETETFYLSENGKKIHLQLESKAKRQLKKDILMSKSFNNI